MSETADNQPPVDPQTPPGSRLQREREKRGWTVVDAAERMHLDPWAIEALEGNRFENVGPAVFAKGHLRQYAFILGLPSADIVAEYEKLRQLSASAGVAPPPLKPAMPAMPSLPEVTQAVSTRLAAPIGGFLAVAALAGLMFAWKPWHSVSSPDTAAASMAGASGASLSSAATSAPLDDAASAAAMPGATDAQPVPAAPVGGTSAAGALSSTMPAAGVASGALPANASGTGRARLRLSFSADSWVEVREAGGAIVYRGKGAANSVKVVSGVAPLSIYLGYVSGVQLEINNHAVAIGPQFVRGDVAKFDAGADGVLRRSPRT